MLTKLHKDYIIYYIIYILSASVVAFRKDCPLFSVKLNTNTTNILHLFSKCNLHKSHCTTHFIKQTGEPIISNSNMKICSFYWVLKLPFTTPS